MLVGIFGRAAAKFFGTKAAAKIATQSLKTGSKEGTKAFSKAATKNTAPIKDAMNSLVLKKGRVGMYLLGGAATLTAVEIASNHAIAKAVGRNLPDVIEKIRETNPEVADFVKEHGLGATDLATKVLSMPADTLTKITAEAMEATGNHKGANAVRIGASLIKPLSSAPSILSAPEGEKAKAYVDWLIKDSDVDRNEVEQYLMENRSAVNALKNNPIQSIDLTEVFPKLAEQQAQISNSSSMLGAFGTASITKFVTDFIEDIMQKLSNFVEDLTGYKLISQTPDDTNAIPAAEMRRDHKLPNNPEQPAFDMG